MVDAFSLKLQRDNRQNALAVDSAKGKAKKAVFSPCCGDETAHALTGPNLFLKATPQKMVDAFP